MGHQYHELYLKHSSISDDIGREDATINVPDSGLPTSENSDIVDFVYHLHNRDVRLDEVHNSLNQSLFEVAAKVIRVHDDVDGAIDQS